jgi:Fur family ferric uptake transcriptional regulator
MADTWQEELRAKGYRVTPQRQLVLEAVTALEHGTPEEICAEVQRTAQGVNISTIYRTLELLEELGLVKHAHLGHGPPNYHPAAQAEHVHLVCRDCESVNDVPPTVAGGLVAALKGEYGFETDVHHLTVYGLCGNCRTTP